MKFTKYHALGNDYIIVDPKDVDHAPVPHEVRALCSRNYGFGSDGVLYGPIKSNDQGFGLRIYNPDASEAEKSGNGLRIFSRYLWDCGLVNHNTFLIKTLGGKVFAKVHDKGKSVSVEMGIVRFTHNKNETPEVHAEILNVKEKSFRLYRANVGNPHCVIIDKQWSPSLAKEYGPLIEADSRFVNRTNVQFMNVIDKSNIQIEIWERGAGYTMASGSSSTAAAAVAHALNLCDSEITVHMPGGALDDHSIYPNNALEVGPALGRNCY